MARDIREVAADLGLARGDLLLYGDEVAKVKLAALGEPTGRLILVTAMSPTLAGEGKTTVAIGLADALRRAGARTVLALRQPSMGPVFGSKGGGAGAGRAQLSPAQSINLHFTGDMHAVTAAHNLLAAALDNHLHFGNALDLDVRRLPFHRVLDVNDRALRQIVVGLGGKQQSLPREDRFDITAASEVMAILALSRDYADLKARLARIVVGVTRSGQLVRAEALRAQGAQAVLLREAMLPNLVQTLEGTPALVHCGPFANIAHGTSSLLATRLGLSRAEVVVQEAGFGADLGAEKFLDIFCPQLGQFPHLAVLVVTLRALALHGRENLHAHLDNMARFGLPTVVALNVMAEDAPADVEAFLAEVPGFPVRVFQEGGAGARALAERVLAQSGPAPVTPAYEPSDALVEKIDKLARGLYGARGVSYAARARAQLADCSAFGFEGAYVCMAKTQYSFSDDPRRPGRPREFDLPIRTVYLLGGANLVVPISGDMMLMPGLGKKPRLETIDLADDGTIVGV